MTAVSSARRTRMSEAQFSIAEPHLSSGPKPGPHQSRSGCRQPTPHGACRAVGGEPRVVGNECSGTVVAVGGGISTIGLLGRGLWPAMSSGRGAYAELPAPRQA